MSLTLEREATSTSENRAHWRLATQRSLSAGGVLKQVWHDCFGTKDVQDAPTLTYTWSADQFGHFNLGLVGSLLLTLLLILLWALLHRGQGGTALAQASPWYTAIAGLAFAVWFANKERNDYKSQ